MLIALLCGCGHPTLDFDAHENAHCEQWGIAKEKRFTAFGDSLEISRACRDVTGLVFADACAWKRGEWCFILLPKAP